MSLLFVANPSSGSADEDLLDAVRDRLGRLGTVDPFVASSAEAFEDELRDAVRGHELVAVAGGDGTLSLAVNALGDRLDEVTFALIPLGTGNDLARTLELDDAAEELAERLAHGSVTDLDVGRVSGAGVRRLFVNACVGGFSVDVDEAVDDREKKRLGPLAFWLGGIRAARDITRYRVAIDGDVIEDVVAAGVGNGRTAGGGLPLWPDASPSDGILNACIVSASTLPAGLKAAAKIKTAKHAGDDQIRSFTGRRFEIEARPEMEINVDGELAGVRTPAVFEVAGAIRMLLPSRPN